MPRFLDYLSPAYSWLAAIDPSLPRALFVAIVFFTVWLIRKLAPSKWEAFANIVGVKSDDMAWWHNELRALWQMLPAAIIGTLYGVLGTGADWPKSLKLGLLGLLAPLVHRAAQRYQGRLGETPKRTSAPSLPLLVLFVPAVVVSVLPWVTGCGAFRSVTPADRAQAYAAQAKATELACKAYVFDVATERVGEVPAMAKLCAGE